MLKTAYAVGEIPHDKYPRPQQMRKQWLNLNGKWDFAKVMQGESADKFTTILVPFSPESESSGIGNGFMLNEGEKLVYKRKVELKNDFLKDVTLLHFGAVDSACKVFVNGKEVGCHECGFTPFTIDISQAVTEGENEIVVEVTDEAKSGAKGKQNKKRGGIWYTPQSGIYQTVWIESLCENYIRNLRYETDVCTKTVTVSADSNGKSMTVAVFDGAEEILKAEFSDKVELTYEFELWSPEHPKLYDVVITNGDGDEVRSYFGVRSFSTGKDADGKPRLLLNGKPYFFTGVLDQGYWPEGLLTYPNDEAVIDELTMLKSMGFNTVRKHIKIEPMRWYYHCDRIGLVVWQDFVNGGGDYKWTHIALFPFLGFHHKDSDYKFFAREDKKGRDEFVRMMIDTVSVLYNFTSIGLWTIFNEGWGQFDSKQMTELLLSIDNTRIIDSASGWHDQGKGDTTLKSLHTYYTPLKVPKDSRPVILSEFGGYSMKISGHVFDENKEFGYKKFRSKQKLENALSVLYGKKVFPLIKKGLCACIYTQVSDVEEEINGLITYDRRVVKVDVNKMRTLNEALVSQLR